MIKWNKHPRYSLLALFLCVAFFVALYMYLKVINATPPTSQSMMTYTNTRFGYHIRLPSVGWSMQENMKGSSEAFQSTFFSKNLPNMPGFSIPPSGNIWIWISKGCIGKPTADFVHEGQVSLQTLCKNGFEIQLGLWNDDTDTDHVQLLQTIANSFSTTARNSVSKTSINYNSVPSSSTPDDGINFPIPAMYSKDVWSLASTTFENGSPVLSLLPSLNASKLFPRGHFYEATNTDPNATTWQKMNASAPADQPEAFYGGDLNFLSYYDQVLTSIGYQQAPLNLDQNLKTTNQAKFTYVLSPLSADGPHGTIRGYIKYSQEKIRVIIISSSDTKNEVFISDVVSLQDLIRRH